MRVTRENREAVFSLIRQLHWLGKTAVEAAAAIGLSVAEVNQCRREIGLEPFELPPNPSWREDYWTAEEDALLAESIAAGMYVDETAERIGRSPRAVTTRRRRLGLPPFKRRIPKFERPVWTPERVAALAQLRAKGASFNRCASRLKTTRGAVARVVHQYLKESADA